MTKSQNFSAKTVEEAKALAARAFGVPMSEIRFEVVEEPKRVFLGITKGNATVRATYEAGDVSAAPVQEEPVAAPGSEPSTLEKIAGDAIRFAQDAVEKVSPMIEDAVNGAVSEVAPVVDGVVNEFTPIVQGAVNDFTPIVQGAINEVSPVVQGAINEVSPVVEKAAEEVAPVVESAVEKVAPVVEGAVQEAASFAENVTSDVLAKHAEPTEAPAPAPAPAASESGVVLGKAPKNEDEKRAPLQLDEELITGEPSPVALQKIEKAKAYLLSVLKEMEVEAELVVNAGSESAMIDIVSQNSGTVIGKRGETLDALQYLTFMIANRGDKEYYRIILNSANYRERRRKTLEELAAKIAKNVLRSGRQTTLEPMNPYERRIIHSAIAEIEGVSSRSVGEEPYRKVVISSTAKPQRRGGGRRNDRNDRGDRNDRRGGGRDRRNGRDRNERRRNGELPSERISMDSMKTSFEKDYKRPKADDEINAGLYGKIEF
jgi:spoIIIJ-associated protein